MLPVRVSNVRRIYEGGLVALDGVSLAIDSGEMLALLGPSGCGKSTLLNLIGCVDLPDAGSVEIDGISTNDLDDDALTRLRRDRVGTVFQFFNLLPTLDVFENVALPLRLQGRSRAAIVARVGELLEAVGIPEKARAMPSQLSGGQTQRVAIARALVHEPAILLADEPTGNLDSQSGERMLELLRSFARRGQTILMVTHSAEAAAAADRSLHMRDGRIVTAP